MVMRWRTPYIGIRIDNATRTIGSREPDRRTDFTITWPHAHSPGATRHFCTSYIVLQPNWCECNAIGRPSHLSTYRYACLQHTCDPIHIVPTPTPLRHRPHRDHAQAAAAAACAQTHTEIRVQTVGTHSFVRA
eukprot:5291959-Prymnesium_polylepis.1